MEIREYKVYKFNELTEEQKERVLDRYSDINVDHEWWDFTLEDANNIGLEITEFDIASIASGKFIHGSLKCADKILKEHGDTCETYKTAEVFLKERDEKVDAAPRDENGDFESEWTLDVELDKLEEEFLHDLLEDYRIILQHEYDYLTSKEAVIETLEANEYNFTEDGKIG